MAMQSMLGSWNKNASWTDPDSIALMVMQSMLGSWNKNAGGGKHMGSALVQRIAINDIAESYMAFNTNYKDSKGRCQAIEFHSVKLLISSRELHQGLKSISSCPSARNILLSCNGRYVWYMIWKKLLLRFLAIQNQASRSTTSLDPNMSRSMIVTLCNCKEDVKRKVYNVIDKFAERGLRSLAVARQKVPEKNKESSDGPWQFVGLLPLFDPPRHDSAETIRRALDLGVNVKMITGYQLAIAKETGRRLGMGTNMYPSSSLLGQHKDESIARLPVDELIEKADGFAGVFSEHKYEIVKKLQESKHIYGMTGDGVNDAPALKKADIGICYCRCYRCSPRCF